MPSHTPAISVITIVKDNEKLISRAIRSTLSQLLADFEYIVVNDGSSDDTKRIIDRFYEDDKRIKPIHLINNVGRAMARNIGMANATAKYIFFLDSDDYLPNNALCDLHEVAETHNSDIVYSGIKCFDSITGEWKDHHYTQRIINHEAHNFTLNDHLDLVENHLIIGRLFKRKMLNENKIAFSKIRKNGEDVLFSFYTAFSAARISMVPEIISYYYSIGNFIATANESKLFDARDNLIESIEYTNIHGSDGLMRKMWQKGAVFASQLERANKVYDGNAEKMRQYIKTLAPLVNCTINDRNISLNDYEIKFANAIKQSEYAKAYDLWKKQNRLGTDRVWDIKNRTGKSIGQLLTESGMAGKDNEQIIKRLEMVTMENRELIFQLESIYKSTSWRISAPLRAGLTKLRSLRKR